MTAMKTRKPIARTGPCSLAGSIRRGFSFATERDLTRSWWSSSALRSLVAGALPVCEERLELRAEFVGGRQRGGLGEQAPTGRRDIGVVLLLERPDDVRDLGVLGDLLGQFFAYGRGGGVQSAGGQQQPGGIGGRLDQRARGLRVVRTGDVVRNVRGEADGVPPGLAEPVLQQSDGVSGHRDGAQPVLLLGQQSLAGGV